MCELDARATLDAHRPRASWARVGLSTSGSGRSDDKGRGARGRACSRGGDVGCQSRYSVRVRVGKEDSHPITLITSSLSTTKQIKDLVPACNHNSIESLRLYPRKKDPRLVPVATLLLYLGLGQLPNPEATRPFLENRHLLSACPAPPTGTGACGPEHGGAQCLPGYCCSKYGYCGTTPAYCTNDICAGPGPVTCNAGFHPELGHVVLDMVVLSARQVTAVASSGPMTCDAGSHPVGGACVQNVCTCGDGSAATGTACTTDRASLCASCNAGYHPEGNTCVANACTCGSGPAATGAACTTDGAVLCTGCNAGYHPMGNICIENVCTCGHGSAATGTACTSHGGSLCASCNAGYHTVGNVCVHNVCTCGHGSAATGSACTTDGGSLCTACIPGYLLQGNVCVEDNGGNTGSECPAPPTGTGACGPGHGGAQCLPGYCCSKYGYCGTTPAYCTNDVCAGSGPMTCNAGSHQVGGACVQNVCTCGDGSAATGAACTTDGAELCTGCDTGYHTEGNVCVKNVCTCGSGPAATEAACTTDRAELCTGCKYGEHSEGGSCVDNTCTCADGSAATGSACLTHGTSSCTGCGAGYLLQGNACVENACTCDNGDAATGTACPTDGSLLCTGCNVGYHPVGGGCAKNICTCDNGNGASGSACSSDGASLCSSCDPGYHMETGACVENSGNGASWIRHGYVENWKTWNTADLDDLTAIFYSFITLDPRPNADNPRNVGWNGQAMYETMTLADVIAVMAEPANSWNYKWQSNKIKSLQQYCTANGKKFIWAVGGWSDLRQTISDEQIPALVGQMVQLLKLGGAHGIDFDWEHVSDISPIRAQQRLIIGKTICALRTALAADPELSGMDIVYTPRYNAFWSGGAYNSHVISTDGEGIDNLGWLRNSCPHGVGAISYINFMMYDINAKEGFKDATVNYFEQRHYDAVVDSSLAFGVPASKIVIGFEPGTQAYTGVWAGMERDKATMKHLYNRGVGGIMWWAMNEVATDSAGSTVGANAIAQAAYAASLAT
eukprot:gene31888-6193_t